MNKSDFCTSVVDDASKGGVSSLLTVAKEDTPVKAEGSAETESTPTDDERYMPVQTTPDPS